MHAITSTGLRRAAAAIAAIGALAGGAAPASALEISHEQTTVTEAGSANGNGVIDPGEGFGLVERVNSSDLATITGLTGVLSSGTAAVTITQASSAYPDFMFADSGANLTPFAGTVAAEAECGATMPLSLALSSAAGSAAVPVALPTGRPGADVAREGADVPQVVPDDGVITSTVQVATAGRVKHVRVRIGSLTHEYMGDLRLVLVAPDGTRVLLAGGRGDSGSGYADTVFDPLAEVSINSGGAEPPYAGSFRPAGDLTALYGKQQQGTWGLEVTDLSPGGTGVLNAWGLDLAPALCDAAAPPPPPPPPPAPVPPGFSKDNPNGRGPSKPAPPGYAKKPVKQ